LLSASCGRCARGTVGSKPSSSLPLSWLLTASVRDLIGIESRDQAGSRHADLAGGAGDDAARALEEGDEELALALLDLGAELVQSIPRGRGVGGIDGGQEIGEAGGRAGRGRRLWRGAGRGPAFVPGQLAGGEIARLEALGLDDGGVGVAGE